MRAGLIDRVGAVLERHGLIVRGSIVFETGEDAPAGPSGGPAKSILLVGHAGTGYWPHFQAWLAGQGMKPANPLDTWSKQVIGRVAAAWEARAVFPSDRPYLPFQQWAMRAEGLKPSPLGILMHPEYGLWHAWRGALLFDRSLDVRKATTAAHPCDDCAEKPCLTSCPVDAVSADGYNVTACIDHLDSACGTPCNDGGCLARNACPVGTEYRYNADAQAFHQAAFLVGNRRH